MIKNQRVDKFIKKLQSEIGPGTRGAPQRREIVAGVIKTHHRHYWNMQSGKYRLLHRQRLRDMSDIARHLPSDPEKESAGRIKKMHDRLIEKIKCAPPEQLILLVSALNIRNLDADLKRYLDMYPAAKSDFRVSRGKIYEYDEDSYWEKYGSRSYPRICNRRINVFNRAGIVKSIPLHHGEKIESALNRIIKNRSKKIAVKNAREKRETERDLRRRRAVVKPAFKVVEKNGNLRSVYDPNFIYRIGRWVEQPPKANHEGGFYCYATAPQAIEAAETGDIFNSAWADGKKLVLCACKRSGKTIRYDNKISTERLMITSEISEITHAI